MTIFLKKSDVWMNSINDKFVLFKVMAQKNDVRIFYGLCSCGIPLHTTEIWATYGAIEERWKI